jgi:periplasmic copper chaperone A
MLTRRLLVALVPAVLLVGPLAGVASAHVEAQAPGATRGGSGTVTFAAEAEETTPLTKLEVALPADPPLVDVTVPPKDGWTSQIAGDRVTWTATGPGVAPEQTGEFPLAVGRFPDTDRVVFKALVTYADGSVVSWIEEQAPGAPEPELPAPVLELAPGTAAAVDPSPAAAAPTAPVVATAEPAPAPEPAADTDPPGVLGVLVVTGLGLAVAAAVAGVRRRRDRVGS